MESQIPRERHLTTKEEKEMMTQTGHKQLKVAQGTIGQQIHSVRNIPLGFKHSLEVEKG